MNSVENQFLEMAYTIGIKLCRDAIWSGNKCNWVGPSMEYMDNNWKVAHRSYGTDLYTGTSGIGHFLSHLYAFTNDPIVKKTALGSFVQATTNSEQVQPVARIGFYTGWAGILNSLQICAPLLKTSEFDSQILEMTKMLLATDITDGGIDVLAGCAGAIPVLIAQAGEQKAKAIGKAKEIGDYLLKIAHKSEKGWSWNTLNVKSTDYTNNLTGFSHGTAGIGWALMELANVTNDDKYANAGQRAFDYERSLFNAKYANWPDLRNNVGNLDSAGSFGSLAWCHGAPGIGLSRIRAYELTGDEVCRKEAEIAIESTDKMISQTFSSPLSNYSLCHGITGNTELLIMAADSFDDENLATRTRQIGEDGIKSYHSNSSLWSCGIMGAGEVPGLMLGTAGIGYFYLRLHDSAQVPSILIPISKRKLAVSTEEKNVLVIAN